MTKAFLILTAAALSFMVLPVQARATDLAREPAHVILDTDMNLDIDDMLALSMLHAFQSRGEAKIIAITCSLEDKWSPSYIDLIDTFYGRPKIPIGIVRNGFKPKGPPLPNGVPLYTQYLSELRGKNGALVFPHRLVDGDKAPDAIGVLRRALAKQPDASVVIVEIGFSTNLARLLGSRPNNVSSLNGIELVRKKVRFLSIMAGNFGDVTVFGRKFPKGSPETNIVLDLPSARRLFADWPTSIVVSGFEIGGSIVFPGAAIQKDFGYLPAHPIAMTYRYMDTAYKLFASKDHPWPWAPGTLHDHNTWDPAAVLYAIRPNDGYFSLSDKGKVQVLDNGGSKFEPRAGGNTQYLLVDDRQRDRAAEAMEYLVSQPPLHR